MNEATRSRRQPNVFDRRRRPGALANEGEVPAAFAASLASRTSRPCRRPFIAAAPTRLAEEASGGYLPSMRAIGLKVLKNKLSEYVRLAASGEIVLITDRDRVVAELTPPQAGRSAVVTDARLADLVRQGLLSPPTIPPGTAMPARKPVMKFAELLEELRDDREDR
jgi:antitoxin (DNA-binding transcriptional repressor) of toxin-antitoxin stability system